MSDITQKLILDRITNLESYLQDKKLEFSKLQTKYEISRNEIDHTESKIRILQEVLNSLTTPTC